MNAALSDTCLLHINSSVKTSHISIYSRVVSCREIPDLGTLTYITQEKGDSVNAAEIVMIQTIIITMTIVKM